MNLPCAKFTVGYATPSRLAKRREILSLYDYERGKRYETWSRTVMRHVDMGVYRWRLSVSTALQHDKASLRRAQQRSRVLPYTANVQLYSAPLSLPSSLLQQHSPSLPSFLAWALLNSRAR